MIKESTFKPTILSSDDKRLIEKAYHQLEPKQKIKASRAQKKLLSGLQISPSMRGYFNAFVTELVGKHGSDIEAQLEKGEG